MFLLKIQIFSTIFHVITVIFFTQKAVLLSRHFRKVRRQIPQCFLFYFFLPREDLELHGWNSWNSFIFCWFHQNLPHGKREKYHHYKTNDDFPYPIGEKLHTPILFTGINTEQVHDIGFPSLEVTLLNNVKLSRICRHFGFAMATGGRKPVGCSKMLIFWHLMNFGRNFPSSLLRWQNGLGTAWPGWKPEVKRPECSLGRWTINYSPAWSNAFFRGRSTNRGERKSKIRKSFCDVVGLDGRCSVYAEVPNAVKPMPEAYLLTETNLVPIRGIVRKDFFWKHIHTHKHTHARTIKAPWTARARRLRTQDRTLGKKRYYHGHTPQT